MGVYVKTKTRENFIFLNKEDALKTKGSVNKWAKNVRLTKRKDKDFGRVYKVSYTYFPFKAKKGK